MMLQVVASPTIVIPMTLDMPFMLLENIYSTSITHDDCPDDHNVFKTQVNGVVILKFYTMAK
jgi:hypothetical protein